VSLAVGAAALLALPPLTLQAQQARDTTVETRAARGRGAGADENIGKERAPNTRGEATPAPAAKGGPQTRGAACIVKVDNRTALYIDVYLDREYRGTVGPWGDLYRYVGCGETRLYARANYDNGTYDTWGPTYGQVYGTYTWRLWP
jgi:hypothetical protein